MFKFLCKKNKKEKESTYLRDIMKYEFQLYKQGIRYNYSKNLLENWQI